MIYSTQNRQVPDRGVGLHGLESWSSGCCAAESARSCLQLTMIVALMVVVI